MIKWGKRNTISRRFHARDDEKAINAWRSDLDKIRRVFAVRSFTAVWRFLTLGSQTEPVINVGVDAPGICHEVPNSPTTVSEPPNDVVHNNPIVSEAQDDTPFVHTVASNSRHDAFKYSKDGEGQSRAVSTTRTLPV